MISFQKGANRAASALFLSKTCFLQQYNIKKQKVRFWINKHYKYVTVKKPGNIFCYNREIPYELVGPTPIMLTGSKLGEYGSATPLPCSHLHTKLCHDKVQTRNVRLTTLHMLRPYHLTTALEASST